LNKNPNFARYPYVVLQSDGVIKTQILRYSADTLPDPVLKAKVFQEGITEQEFF